MGLLDITNAVDSTKRRLSLLASDPQTFWELLNAEARDANQQAVARGDALASAMPQVRDQAWADMSNNSGAQATNWMGGGLLGITKPPNRLFRGIGENTGKNTYTLGKGLYTSPDRSFAAQYGKVYEIPVDQAMPKNPLIISGGGRGDAQGLFADWALEKTGLPNMREFNKAWKDPAEFVKSLGYDGVWIGSEIVKF